MASSHASLELPPPNQGTSLVDRINISIHFRRYFKIISRRWWIPFLLVLVGTGIALYVALTTPNKYRAYSTLGFTSRVETGVGGKAQVVELADGFVEHQLVLMKSPRVRNKAQEYMREIDAALGVHPELESSVSKGAGSLFMMTVDSTDLRYASLYVSNWARAFVAYKNEVNTELIEKKFGQTRQEVKRYEQNLEKARESIDL